MPSRSEKTATTSADWRSGLPDLFGKRLKLRELHKSDAPHLYAEFTRPEVRPFMWAPPPTVAAFESYIEWTHSERQEGKYIGYALVPRGVEHARGVFELRRLQPGFVRGELGFVIAPSLWGTGAFNEAARLLLDFAFRTVKVHRIEARAAVDNVRGNAALRKLGATREGTLKEAFVRDERYVDQYLWSLLDTRWSSER
ncbi:MAG TPA: GNAT family protein [Vicinamibacterales bacterium]|jgi:ribosomal-protein-alanine N-acetyltransferase